MKGARNPRVAAARAVAAVLTNHHSLATALPAVTVPLSPEDRSLTQEICYGTLRHLFSLEGLILPLLKRPFKRRDNDLYALLLCGGYQLLYLRTPDHAILSETVAATAAFNKGWGRGVINAVLRRLQRLRDSDTLPSGENLSAQYDHPEWLVRQLQQERPQQWQQILQQNLQRPPMTLRVNLNHHSREAYLQQLQQVGLEGALGHHAPTAITLQRAVAVEQLPGFDQGWVSVQDEAAQLSARLLDPQPGERILDACAAPGGKTIHLLEQAPGVEQLVAIDHDADRLARIEENLQRGDHRATLLTGDVTTDHWWDGQPFDRILLDAPCSATGVIRRHPDIKLLRRAEDIVTLASTQSAILEQCWRVLKPGGTLLYATCSILKQENTSQLELFFDRHDDVTTVPFSLAVGTADSLGVQILPGEGGMDGFYYALLRKY